MRTLALLGVLLLVLVVGGCGGGGGSTPTQTSGTLEGQVNAANASDYDLIVDGQALAAAPDASGRFSIPNLPAGTHSLTVVGGAGFMGAHVSFTIRDSGGTVDVGDIVPSAGGQIVGLVSKSDDNGNLTPLEGVEVLADAEPIYYEDGTATTPIAPADGEAVQLRAVTDSNGSYVIPAVPEGSYVVSVSVPGLVQGINWVYVSPGTTAVADFQLLEAIEEGVGTVTGTVTGVDAESREGPLEGATVTVCSDGTWSPTQPSIPVPLPVEALAKALVPKCVDAVMPPDYNFEQFMTLTDAAGHYSLNVPSGHLQVNVWAEGYDCAYETVTLHPRETLSRDYKLTAYTEPPVEIQGAKKKSK